MPGRECMKAVFHMRGGGQTAVVRTLGLARTGSARNRNYRYRQIRKPENLFGKRMAATEAFVGCMVDAVVVGTTGNGNR